VKRKIAKSEGNQINELEITNCGRRGAENCGKNGDDEATGIENGISGVLVSSIEKAQMKWRKQS